MVRADPYTSDSQHEAHRVRGMCRFELSILLHSMLGMMFEELPLEIIQLPGFLCL